MRSKWSLQEIRFKFIRFRCPLKLNFQGKSTHHNGNIHYFRAGQRCYRGRCVPSTRIAALRMPVSGLGDRVLCPKSGTSGARLGHDRWCTPGTIRQPSPLVDRHLSLNRAVPGQAGAAVDGLHRNRSPPWTWACRSRCVARVAGVGQLQRLTMRAEINIRIDRMPSTLWNLPRLNLHYFLLLSLPPLLSGSLDAQCPLTDLIPLIESLKFRLDTIRILIHGWYRLGSNIGGDLWRGYWVRSWLWL